MLALLLPISLLAQPSGLDPSFTVLRPGVGLVSNTGLTLAAPERYDADLFVADLDADRIPDQGAFDKEVGLFTIRRSSDGATLLLSVPRSKGRPVVAAADFDGDKRSDPTIWRNGFWHKLLSSRGYSTDLAIFGIVGDIPVPADYDGDGRADLAIFRPSENRWYIQNSDSGKVTTFDLGIAGTDLLLPADYSGDGKADIAVYRSGTWLYIDSETGRTEQLMFGSDDSRPVPADVDHDGTAELAFFRHGRWFVYNGSSLVSYRFGSENDRPVGVIAVRSSTPGR